MKNKFFLLLLACVSGTAGVSAQISMPKIFSDNMVLQRDMPLKIWGWAGKGEKVQVSFHGQNAKAAADNQGRWSVILKPMRYDSNASEMKISGTKNEVDYKNILLGDVWVCSGQSNMEFPVSGWTNVKNYKEEIANANYPQVRLFTVEKNINTMPDADVKGGEWQECSPATISPFSAVGYFFGRDLYEDLHIPIGLINSTWGGTDIETWISRASLDTSSTFKSAVAHLPHLSMDSLREVQKQALMDIVQKLQGGLPNAATIKQWKDPSYNDSRWPEMQLPSVWEDRQLGRNFDGEVWFRKEISIGHIQNGDTAELSLCMIDDNDETYVNGVKVGSTEGYNTRRIYKIMPGVLHAGQNSIVVKVDDGGGNGGIYGAPEDLYLRAGNAVISLAGAWRFQVASIITGGGAFGPNSYPSLLYNAMINPIIHFGIKGAIWYQGENNAVRGYQYRKAMPLLIRDWRNHWNEGSFPFYFVQIATFNANNGNSNRGSAWAELRESQTETLSKVPNTGMAVTTDIGDPDNIHPTDKQDVGKRLAALALKNTYGKHIVASGPMYKNMRINGNHVLLSFTGIGSGLYVKGDALNGFEIAGADRKFYPAKAVVVGDRVEVYSDKVDKPASVRYAWADDASTANLYNKEEFPAVPFRTDDWPAVTRDVKYRIDL